MDAKLIGLLTASDDEAIAFVTMELYEMGYEIITDNTNYVFGIPGDDNITPVMLMAHLDTRRTPGQQVIPSVFFDTLYNETGEECGCLGADDRAGAYIVLEIAGRLANKPYVLFTTGEETGHTGAAIFLKTAHPERVTVSEEFYAGKTIIEPYIPDIYAILQYDRQGFNSVVTYGSASKQHELIDKALTLGYTHDYGTTSDSRNITETYGIAHLNLSAGFLHQHTPQEMLLLPALDFATNNGVVLAQMIDKPYRVEKEHVFSGWPPAGQYKTYPPRMEDKPEPEDYGTTPQCDICGKHRTVYYIKHAHAVVCKKCIRRAGGEDKITVETIDSIKYDLYWQRERSKMNNLPFVPSCPNGMDHKDISREDDGVMWCDDCGTYFWQDTEGAFSWELKDSTTATYRFYAAPEVTYEVSAFEEQCPLNNCQICGRLMPDKRLSYYTDITTNEVGLVVCDKCNAIDPPSRRYRYTK